MGYKNLILIQLNTGFLEQRVMTPFIPKELFVKRFFFNKGRSNSWSEEIIKLYGKPVFDSGNSKATLSMMRMVPDGPNNHPKKLQLEMRKIEEYVI